MEKMQSLPHYDEAIGEAIENVDWDSAIDALEFSVDYEDLVKDAIDLAHKAVAAYAVEGEPVIMHHGCLAVWVADGAVTVMVVVAEGFGYG